MRVIWLAPVCIAACVQSTSVECEFGTCPSGTECDELHDRCVLADQLTSCGSSVDGDDCTIRMAADGTCDQGVCLDKRCGDGYQRGGEECDGEELGERASCTAHGFYDDVAVGCATDCSYDLDPCFANAGYCGDNTIQTGIEFCEPPADPVSACFDLGFDAGHLHCTAACGPEITGCKQYGWNVARVTPTLVTDVRGDSPTNVWAVGNDFVQHFDGTQWTTVDISSCFTGYFYTVLPVGADTFVAGIDGIAKLSGTSCETWQTIDVKQTQRMWASGPNDVYAIGLAGLNHYDGTTWTKLTVSGIGGVPGPTAVWGRGPTDVYVSLNDQLRHYNGTAWLPMTGFSLNTIHAIWGTATELYVAGRLAANAVVWRYSGGTWTQVFARSGNVYCGAVIDGRVFIGGEAPVTSQPTLYAYDGHNWSDLQPPPSPFGVAAMTPIGNGQILTGIGGTIQRYGGASYLPPMTGALAANRAFAQVVLRDNEESYAIVAEDAFQLTFLLYTWVNPQWVEDTSVGVPHELVRHPKSNAFYAMTATGVYVNEAGTWTELVKGFSGGEHLWPIANDDIWMWNGGIYHWDGANVTQCATCPDVQIGAMWGSSTADVYAVGGSTDGVVLHYNGTSWTELQVPVDQPWRDVWGTSADDVYIVGYLGSIIHWDGTTWHDESLTLPADLRSITGRGSTDVVAGSDTGLMFHRDPTDGRWSPMNSGAVTLGPIDAFGDVLIYPSSRTTVGRLARTHDW